MALFSVYGKDSGEKKGEILFVTLNREVPIAEQNTNMGENRGVPRLQCSVTIKLLLN